MPARQKPITVWFIIVDNELQHTLRPSASVDVPPSGTVQDFLVQIKAKGWDALKINEANEYLNVWQLRTPARSWEIKNPNYLKDLDRLPRPEEEEAEAEAVEEEEEEEEEEGKGKGKVKVKVKTKAAAWLLEPEDEISLLFKEPAPGNSIRVLVQVPPRAAIAKDNFVLDPEHLKEYQGISIVAHEWGVFQFADFAPNDIESAASVPDFVTKFEQELDKRSGVTSDVRPTFALISDPRPLAAYSEPSMGSTDVGESNEEENQPPRHAGLVEVLHIGLLARSPWERRWQGSPLKEALMNEMFFSVFVNSVLDKGDEDSLTVQLGNTPWPFNLVTKSADVRSNVFRTYRPCSDCLLLKSFIPRLLVEVNSTSVKIWPEDLIRMLLQGAAVVRFANTFLNTFNAKNFVLFAIFVYDDGNATRYTLFQQRNHRTVYYKEKSFDLKTPEGRVEFALQFYNLLHKLRGDEPVSDVKAKIRQLQEKISKQKNDFGMKSFYSKGGDQEASRKRPRTGDGAGAAGGAVAGGAYAAYCTELRARSYEVQPDVIVNASGVAFEPLLKMPPNILTVYRPSEPDKKLIAKKVREESNELALLNLLNTTRPKSIHIIPLLDSFHTQSALWIIIPKMDTIVDCLRIAPEQLAGNVNKLCEGLIEGLGYLHGLCIAHRDIKPNNLLVDQAFCLKIIDFDLALQLKDEDEEVDDQCGTENWMAPEIEEKPMYSPIKADRWSCGHVILYLLDKFKSEDKHLRSFANSLTAHDPKRRPSLLEWASSSDALPSDVANVSNAGERRVLRPLRDKMEASRGNTLVPEAKKRRLAGSDQKDRKRGRASRPVAPAY